MTGSRRTAAAAGLALALLALAATWFLLGPPPRTSPGLPELGRVPPFRLTTEAGAGADESLFRDRVSIVDFIFTSCAGICPIMSGRMAWIQQELHDLADVRLVSVSVDPETDTPAVLTSYGERFGAVPGRWTFLTGDRDAIYSLTREGFKLGVETEGTDAIIHSEKFVLVDGGGTIRGYYSSDSTDALDLLLDHARSLSAGGGR